MEIKNKKSPIIPFHKGDGLQNRWFTLVELIVVITILAVLSTIWFVSYSWYLTWVRDTNRISQLKSISEWLNLYSTNHSLPSPDVTSTAIMDWTTKIATQWYAWKNVLETINYSTEWVDPKDKQYFSYYLTSDKKYFQLMAFLEEEDNLQNTATAIDYSTRYPTVYWDKLWILTTNENAPIQESTWSIDISNVWTTELKSYLKDGEYVTWTWMVFSQLTKISQVWWRWYETDSNHYGFLWTDLDPINCPTWFIPVSSDWQFTTKDFCVAQYEMTYIDANTPNSTWWWEDWNTVAYNSSKIPVSMAGKYPIADITQSEAIAECSKIWAHLITNNEWMTIARWIEEVSTNWSSGKVWVWNLYNWVSNNTTLWCDAKWWNSDSRMYATTTWAWSDELCNKKRSHRLYNGQIIWDLSWNVNEHVNKANTYDWSWYNVWQTIVDWSSYWTWWDDNWIYTTTDMDKYGSKYHLWISSWMWNLYYANWVVNNVFIRGAAASHGTTAGVFLLSLARTSTDLDRFVGFRCVTF